MRGYSATPESLEEVVNSVNVNFDIVRRRPRKSGMISLQECVLELSLDSR